MKNKEAEVLKRLKVSLEKARIKQLSRIEWLEKDKEEYGYGDYHEEGYRNEGTIYGELWGINLIINNIQELEKEVDAEWKKKNQKIQNNFYRYKNETN